MNGGISKVNTLSTDQPCHLQDLLRPLPHAAFPPSVRLEEGEEEKRDPRRPTITVTKAPYAAQLLWVGEISQMISKSAVSIQAMMDISVMTGYSGRLNHVPLSKLLRRRGGFR